MSQSYILSAVFPFFKRFIFLFDVYVHMYSYEVLVEARGGIRPLELELQVVVGAGHRAQVLYKGSQRS